MKIKIANRYVGDGCPTFIIAEIGSNHNQSFDLAIESIKAAKEAGADAVKFQTFKADKHISRFANIPTYLEEGGSLHSLIQKLELDRSWQKKLKIYSEELDLIFFSSPCDYEAVDELENIGSPAHKIASFDLPDLDLVRYIAKTGKPILLSTGLANWMEIQRAIDVCHEEGNEDIILFQCTSIYPAPENLSNLRAIEVMRKSFNVLTGYSDHTLGDNIPVVSVGMGSCIIEKHFTMDRSLDGPDHKFAMTPDEFKIMVKKIRNVEAAFGDGVKNGPRPEEMEMFTKARRSLHASQDIKAGEMITSDMLCCKRPGQGIEPYLKDKVIGRRAKCDIKADHWIEWKDL